MTGSRAQVAAAEPVARCADGPAADALAGDQPLVLQVGGRAVGRRSWSSSARRSVVGVSGVLTMLLLGGLARGARRDGVVDRAGDGGDDLLLVMSATLNDAVVASEPQHDDPVGDGHDVGHVVADEDHAVAALAQPLDEVEHLGGLRDAERRGGLVEDDDLGDRRAAIARSRRSGAARRTALRPGCAPTGSWRQLAQQPPGLASPCSTSSSGRPRAQLAAEPQVGDDVEVVAQREVLEHRRDAELLRIGRAADLDRLAVELDDLPSSGV